MNYTELKTRIQNWLEDEYSEFSGSIDTMIENAEYRISRDLNMDAMIEHVTGTFTAGNETHPIDANVVAVRNFRITVGGKIRQLFFRETSYLYDYWPNLTKKGAPEFYANHDATNWLIIPPPDQAYNYEIESEKRVLPIKTLTNTWLGDNWPDLLFYACCLEAGVFDQDARTPAVTPIFTR